MKFDKKGISKLNKQVNIDFETMAKHLLILEKTARKNGMYIKKVIFMYTDKKYKQKFFFIIVYTSFSNLYIVDFVDYTMNF